MRNLDLKSRRLNKNLDNLTIVQKFVHGEDIPDEIKKHQAIYDMILVERINAPLKTSAGSCDFT